MQNFPSLMRQFFEDPEQKKRKRVQQLKALLSTGLSKESLLGHLRGLVNWRGFEKELLQKEKGASKNPKELLLSLMLEEDYEPGLSGKLHSLFSLNDLLKIDATRKKEASQYIFFPLIGEGSYEYCELISFYPGQDKNSRNLSFKMNLNLEKWQQILFRVDIFKESIKVKVSCSSNRTREVVEAQQEFLEQQLRNLAYNSIVISTHTLLEPKPLLLGPA
ncbi:hypothetical protein ACFL35_18710 [Candidatus Riflebacteria bacterium]